MPNKETKTMMDYIASCPEFIRSNTEIGRAHV